MRIDETSPLSWPLRRLVAALRSDELPLPAYIDLLADHVQRWEPEIATLLPEKDRFGRLRRQAIALEARYPDPRERPVLYGIPVGVKDIFHSQGFVTRAGSRLPESRLQGQEATSVSRLKAAGALVLGKTVTTEFAYFAPGPTRNPHKHDHTPGGSSSGSAAAVAAGFCPLALGTQTIGSIIRPAAYCGVAGFKPTYDRISREGVIPLSPSLNHIGLFARYGRDLLLAAQPLVLGWSDPHEAARPVLGIPDGPYLGSASKAALAAFDRATTQLMDAGYEVRRVPAMPDFQEIADRHKQLMAGEAAAVHDAWYAEYQELYHPKTAELLELGLTVDNWSQKIARGGRRQLRRELQALMDDHGLDVWLAPSAVDTAPAGLDSTGDPIMNLPWTHAGLPAVNLPCGWSGEGLPYGLQIVGRWHGDEALLRWSEDLAAALHPLD